MKLYIELKEMVFDDGKKYEIIYGMSDKEFPCYDVIIDIPDDDKFIQDTMQIVYKKDERGNETDEIESRWFITKEQETWNSYPLYQLKNGKIEAFDYTKHQYFLDTERRVKLAEKIGHAYGSPSEFKILRKTLAYIMDELKLKYPPGFDIMNKKIEGIIEKSPKGKIK